jgi:hypothetical protein
MRKQWKGVFGLCVIGMGLGVGAAAHAASGVGPYYATPSWDQTLPAATRFIVLTNMNSEAVLDRETGVVWEQSPSTTAIFGSLAPVQCTLRTTGGRKGWRLPSVHELASLIDPNNPGGNPDLPAGHPFSNVQAGNYWSATRDPDFALIWAVSFSNGSALKFNLTTTIPVWCVRGGMNADAY